MLKYLKNLKQRNPNDSRRSLLHRIRRSSLMQKKLGKSTLDCLFQSSNLIAQNDADPRRSESEPLFQSYSEDKCSSVESASQKLAAFLQHFHQVDCTAVCALTLSPWGYFVPQITAMGNDRPSEKTIVEGNPILPPWFGVQNAYEVVCVSGEGPLVPNLPSQ